MGEYHFVEYISNYIQLLYLENIFGTKLAEYHFKEYISNYMQLLHLGNSIDSDWVNTILRSIFQTICNFYIWETFLGNIFGTKLAEYHFEKYISNFMQD